MLRETNSSLDAWDVFGCSEVTLEPGSLLSRCRILRHNQTEIDSGAEAYEVEFHVQGRLHICPLFRFQPRTQAVEMTAAEGLPARDTVAV